jgi:outer membrane protein assembly factor BamB
MLKVLPGIVIPCALALIGVGLLVIWVSVAPHRELLVRVDGMDFAPAKLADRRERLQPGEPIAGEGRPSSITSPWPWFRGPNHDAISPEPMPLARKWPEGGPKRLWKVELGDGYAAAAVSEGRVYVLDHVADLEAESQNLPPEKNRSADVLRCLSLDDGREIWRNSYRVIVPQNHGMSRTIPTVIGKYVVTLGPMCHVVCWDAESGKYIWSIDLVREFGAKVPEWYAGQCPLFDAATDQLILAPGGKSLLIAVDYKTGKILWESPNPMNWSMTHSSIMPMELGGRRMYVYCGSGGVAGVAADNGSILWETIEWRIANATCPSPVVIGDGWLFFSGGYQAGALMLGVEKQADHIAVKTLFRLSHKDFGSEQQTPIFWKGYLYGVRQNDKQLVCLDLNGQLQWQSKKDKFGSAPYVIADGLIYALNDEGALSMIEASPNAYQPLAKAQVLESGVDCWGPMALAGGRLILRDLTRMICLQMTNDEARMTNQ